MDVQINVWAVILAAVSSMVIGSIWYAKGVFGNTWIKLAKLDDKKMREGAPMALGIAFLASLVMAYVLAHVSYLSNQFFGNSFLYDTMMTAFWVWLGFQGFRAVMHDAFEGRRKKLTLINIGNDFVTIMVMALIIGLMKP